MKAKSYIAGVDGKRSKRADRCDHRPFARKCRKHQVEKHGCDSQDDPLPYTWPLIYLRTDTSMVWSFNIHLAENLVLQQYFEPEFQKYGFLRFDKIYEYSNKLISEYDIRSGSGPMTTARSMSGGNQQKAIAAREISRSPDLLLAVQPTRGLDVGAIEYMHSQIVRVRDAGKAVLVVSFDLNEVMNLADRILVMFKGEIVANVKPDEVTENELGLYMAGVKRVKCSERNR